MAKKEANVEEVDISPPAKKREYPVIGFDPGGSISKLVIAIGDLGTTTREGIKNKGIVGKTTLGVTISVAKQYGLIERRGMQLGLTALGLEYYNKHKNEDFVGMKDVAIKVLASVDIFNNIVKRNDSYIPTPVLDSVRSWVSALKIVPKKDINLVAGAFRTSLRSWNISFSELKNYILTGPIQDNPDTKNEEAEPKAREFNSGLIKDAVEIAWKIKDLESKNIEETQLIGIVRSLKIPEEFQSLKAAVSTFIENIGYLDKTKLKDYIHENILKAFCKDVGIKYEDKKEVTNEKG